ncbi:MAG TPA: hypothetical protein VMC82_03550 [Thermoplasmata archaeon]|nr:hypothetical protein [Thermoplasmata archaeon]
MASATPSARPAPRRGLTKSQKIGLGLLLTLGGLALLSALLPTAPERLGYVLPVVAAGILLLWVGGILMGIGSRS